MSAKHTNALINESSPYLLQHAHNPVAWEAWNTKAITKAKANNKLILISIGYAACHWCHVMEHECFEDTAVADIMNANFINIKIDREERPDIDQIYMDALQIMTGNGGWPLNIVALPDGRPFWGATYVPKSDWTKVLAQLSALYASDPERVVDYATDLTDGLKKINILEKPKSPNLPSIKEIGTLVTTWFSYFDTFLGGYKKAPKFMMPVNLNFLLQFGETTKNKEILSYVDTTLTRMAWGGIFDPIGGGFSRYAVDTKWHIPHFEKMLYDNGQLLSIYSKRYAVTKNNLYKDTALKIIQFLKEELLDKNGGFYASLDADSLTDAGILVEGAYYVWKEEELITILKSDFPLFKEYYNINKYGYWEHGTYVLIRDGEKDTIAANHKITIVQLEDTISSCLTLLKLEREKRNKPRLDTKILTSWNGLVLKGLTDAYRYLEDDNSLKLALSNANFIVNNLLKENCRLVRSYSETEISINGFLEDYATIIDAFIGLYEVTFNLIWLDKATQMTAYVFENFSDTETGLFFYTSKLDKSLIRRTIEVTDNVIPSSNAIMAFNLFKLYKLTNNTAYKKRLDQILKSVKTTILERPESHAHWLSLYTTVQQPFYEVAIVGAQFLNFGKIIAREYLPNMVLAATAESENLPLLENRFTVGKTNVHICENSSCQLPKKDVNEAIAILKKNLSL